MVFLLKSIKLHKIKAFPEDSGQTVTILRVDVNICVLFATQASLPPDLILCLQLLNSSMDLPLR